MPLFLRTLWRYTNAVIIIIIIITATAAAAAAAAAVNDDDDDDDDDDDGDVGAELFLSAVGPSNQRWLSLGT